VSRRRWWGEACSAFTRVAACTFARSPSRDRYVVDLQTAINAYLAEHNASPIPFVWTKSAEVILVKLDRFPVTSI
jgi:hypothetical protein